MEDPLVTYLNDHLTGARFAISLLKDLSEQSMDVELSRFAKNLLLEVEADQACLYSCVTALHGGSNIVKEAAAWVAQKAGKVKLSVDTRLGQFEAIEALMLGVRGKLALWEALSVLTRQLPLSEEQLRELRQRAVNQRKRLEEWRIQLSKFALEFTDA